jgi:hypothetical protein
VTPVDKWVEIDRQPGERSSCHNRQMAGFHGASTRDQLCASAAASPYARPEQPRKHHTAASIGGYGVDMSTPQKSLKYKAITPIAQDNRLTETCRGLCDWS